MQMPQMAKNVFIAGFIALRTVAVKPHSQWKLVAFSEPDWCVSFY
jgi:hypothetical protein